MHSFPLFGTGMQFASHATNDMQTPGCKSSSDCAIADRSVKKLSNIWHPSVKLLGAISALSRKAIASEHLSTIWVEMVGWEWCGGRV